MGGQDLGDSDLARIADEHLEESGIPSRLRPAVKPVARAILAHVLAGDKQTARTYASEQAIGLGDELARSAQWTSDPDDGFDPREVAARVSRV